MKNILIFVLDALVDWDWIGLGTLSAGNTTFRAAFKSFRRLWIDRENYVEAKNGRHCPRIEVYLFCEPISKFGTAPQKCNNWVKMRQNRPFDESGI